MTKTFTVGNLAEKAKKNFHCMVTLAKNAQKYKTSSLVTLAKNDQEKTKTFTVANLGQK